MACVGSKVYPKYEREIFDKMPRLIGFNTVIFFSFSCIWYTKYLIITK